jgi:hypothetical protein
VSHLSGYPRRRTLEGFLVAVFCFRRAQALHFVAGFVVGRWQGIIGQFNIELDRYKGY